MGKKGDFSGSECGKFLDATLASLSFSEIADLLRFSFQPALEFTKTDPKRRKYPVLRVKMLEYRQTVWSGNEGNSNSNTHQSRGSLNAQHVLKPLKQIVYSSRRPKIGTGSAKLDNQNEEQHCLV